MEMPPFICVLAPIMEREEQKQLLLACQVIVSFRSEWYVIIETV